MKLIKRGELLFGCRRRGDKLVGQLWVTGTEISAERQQAILDRSDETNGSSVEPKLVDALIEPLSETLALDIQTWSRLGNGLVFTVEVPIDSHSTETAIRHEKHDFKGTILVASDAPIARNELMLLLRELGHEPLSAPADVDSVALSAKKFGGMRPEIIVVDYGSRNEKTAFRIVRALRNELGLEVPVIALVDDISQLAELNAIAKPCAYLPKPVQATELGQQIASLLADVRYRAAASIRHHRDAVLQTIFVIDDDNILRSAVQDVFRLRAQDVELYPSSESFLESYNRDRRGCLIVDNRLPGMTGVELLEQLKAEGSSLPSIMITAHGDVPTAVRALKAGAIDYIEKPISYEGLLSAVERALEINRGSADTVVKRREMAARVADLTPRERQVMDLVVSGRSSKKIAQILNISQRTVENHRAAIMRRVGAASLSDLIRIVMQLRSSDNL
jgi:two-component system, chemotaxis family, CheB/CheR fusion protein